MPPPPDIQLGPLTRAILARSNWTAESEFPAHQDWADEIERVFSFLQAEGVLDRFMPRLTTREYEGAIAEARVAFFFKRNGFRIEAWEPRVTANPGDLEIGWASEEPIFVEIKGPTWKGELSEDEIDAGRQNLPQYINGDARAIDPCERVIFATVKALPKFSPNRINLVVVADNLFMSPLDVPRAIRDGKLARGLVDARFGIVGGLFILSPTSYSERPGVEYRHYFFPNPGASRPLPEAVATGLLRGNKPD